MKKIIRLTENDLTNLVKKVLEEKKNSIFENSEPQGLLQTINTPIEKLQILGCKTEPCDSVLWVKGDGGTFKFKVEILTPAGKTGIKYRNFKKIPNGYQFIGYPTNSLVATGALAAKTLDKTETKVKYNSTNLIKCSSNPNTKLSVKDMSNNEILKPTVLTWTQNYNKYCVRFTVPTIGSYKEILITQNKPETTFGTSELIIFFNNEEIQEIKDSLRQNSGRFGSLKQPNGTIILTYQP